MQSGYGEQTLFYIFFSFIIEKKMFVNWFHFQNQGFVIFLNGATETDFFENGRWNYMTIASKPHILFLWWFFLRLGSTSSCGGLFYPEANTFWKTSDSFEIVRYSFFMFAINCPSLYKYLLLIIRSHIDTVKSLIISRSNYQIQYAYWHFSLPFWLKSSSRKEWFDSRSCLKKFKPYFSIRYLAFM